MVYRYYPSLEVVLLKQRWYDQQKRGPLMVSLWTNHGYTKMKPWLTLWHSTMHNPRSVHRSAPNSQCDWIWWSSRTDCNRLWQKQPQKILRNCVNSCIPFTSLTGLRQQEPKCNHKRLLWNGITRKPTYMNLRKTSQMTPLLQSVMDPTKTTTVHPHACSAWQGLKTES
jgi:hypothetical protein